MQQSSRVVLEVVRLGLKSYSNALRVQQSYVARHREGRGKNVLLLCEHPPVYTVGRRQASYTPREERRLKLLGAEFVHTDRGGLITFHGPGQLVCYPILDLACFRNSVPWYVGALERTGIQVCREFGIEASTSPPHRGVWVGHNKICAIGCTIQTTHSGHYITSHGLALNCNTDMTWFEHIVPCGVVGKGMTSLTAELGRTVTTAESTPYLLEAFRQQFNCLIVEGEKEHSDNQPEDPQEQWDSLA